MIALQQAWPMPSTPRPIVIIGAGGIVKDAHLPAYRKAGFLVAGPYDDVGNQDAKAAAQIRANTLDDIVTAAGSAFLGLTINCARCHDHKFDPITARDYHALYGILASSRVNMHVLDAPERLHALDADLRTAKERMRGELVKVWRDELARWPERFADEPWRKAIAAAAGDPAHVLYPLSQAFTPVAWRDDQQRRRHRMASC